MIRNYLFSIFFFSGIILISIIFLPSLFLPQSVVLFGGKIMGFWSGICLKIFMSTKIIIKGKENIIKDKKFFIASSHQSMFETFFLQTIFNSPIFILKKELIEIPIFGWYLKKIGSISIDRNKISRENIGFSNEILKNETYCYRILGYKDNKISKSNSICVTSQDNYNPIPIPTAFTPNDDGLNDEFKPYDSGVSDFKMLIFNKFGEKIFESNDINLGWDGYFNGKIVQGSYVYKMEFILDSKNVVQTGKFLLIK